MHVLRVRHVSPRGPAYTRAHVIVRGPRSGPLLPAIAACGAVAPAGAAPRIVHVARHPDVPEIVFPDATRPVAHDPAGLLVQLIGCSVYVDVPYRCSFDQLQRAVIPDKLRHMGVHAFAVRGALMRPDGRAACAGDVWGNRVATLWWTKLRARVEHQLAPRTVRGITRLQQRVRQRQARRGQWEPLDLEEYELVA